MIARRYCVSSGLVFGLWLCLSHSAAAQVVSSGRPDILARFSTGTGSATVDGRQTTTTVRDGSASFSTADARCKTKRHTPCTYVLNSLDLGVNTFNIEDQTISGLRIRSWYPILVQTKQTTIDLGFLRISGPIATLPANIPFNASFTLGESEVAMQLTNPAPIFLLLEPTTNSLIISGRFEGMLSGRSVSASVTMTADRPFANLAPRADAGPDLRDPLIFTT